MSVVKDYWSRHPKRKKYLVVSAVFTMCTVLFLTITFWMVIGLSKHPQAIKAKNQMISIVKNILSLQNLTLPVYYIKGLMIRPESLTINIKYKNMQKLEYMRKALLGEAAEPLPSEYVPAKIDYEGKSIPIKIRLKGARLTHYSDNDEWSFRVNVRGDNTIFGMKRFAIHKPRTRNYIYEWLFHEVLKREGLIALRYKFINVTLNGKDLGVYALEEQFGKHLIEYNQKREGPIIRFIKGPHFQRSSIVPYEIKEILTSNDKREMLNKAVSLLESFRRGTMKHSEVFDVKKLATFFAITDLLGTHHSAITPHMRFYYNPITSKLEPIGFDGHLGTERTIYIAAELGINPEASWLYDSFRDWFRTFFNDKDTFDERFFSEYIKALERISHPSYLEKLFSDIKDSLEHNLSLIYRDFPPFADHIFSFGPDLFLFSKDILLKRQDYIRQTLNPMQGINAYFKESSQNSMTLELSNIHKTPIKIISATYNNTQQLMPDKEVILFPEPPSSLTYQDVLFKLPRKTSLSEKEMITGNLKVNYMLLGMSEMKHETVSPYSHFVTNFIEHDFIRQPPNIHEFHFLKVDESKRKIFIKTGSWNLRKNLIIPEGYRVFFGGGTQLDISNSAKILSYSPLEFIGTENAPIFIHSTDKSGQGIIVINANQKSILRYTVFENLSTPSQGGWKLSGTISFYESPVEIKNCQFISNNSEDGLNIVRSDFSIDNTSFKKASSDAIDIDFGKGEITNSSFVGCVNDAIDISGSHTKLKNIFINGAGDKGLSIGENSRMIAENIKIENSKIAIASKDSSTLDANNVKISDCEIGLAAYQKKNEFGPGSIIMTNAIFSKVETLHMVETGSSLRIEKKEIKPHQKVSRKIIQELIKI